MIQNPSFFDKNFKKLKNFGKKEERNEIFIIFFSFFEFFLADENYLFIHIKFIKYFLVHNDA